MIENRSQSRASYGKRHEYIVIAELLRHGFDVYIPLVDDRQIDCIVRRGDNDYLDLQIKSRSENGQFAGLKIEPPRRNYFFVFYVESVNTRWIFPSCELVEKANPIPSGQNEVRYDITLVTRIRRKKKFCEYIDTDGTFECLRGTEE